MAFPVDVLRLSDLIADRIVGAFIATAESGLRWVIASPFSNTIVGFSGDAAEQTPAIISVDPAGGMRLMGPDFGATGGQPFILLFGPNGSPNLCQIKAKTIMLGDTDTIDLWGVIEFNGGDPVMQQDVLGIAANPNSVANVTLSGLQIDIVVNDTREQWAVELDADVTVPLGTNVIELLVDGIAEAAQIITGTTGSNIRIAGHKKWLITGLSVGPHSFTARTRMIAASTNATVNATHTIMTTTREA